MFGHHAPAAPLREARIMRRDPLPLLLGTSMPMREIERALDGIAQADVNLLIQGEPGTGKRILAQAIHARSFRSREPFHALALGGLTEAQAEREFFGDEDVTRLVQLGARPTLYLEAVEALSPKLQAHLAEIIATGNRWANVRLIAGTVASLDELVRLGRFRHDLATHLGAVRFVLPSLRERREDIRAIAEAYARRWCESTGKARLSFARAALAELASYTWPGNLRELEQTLEAALAVTRSGEIGVERIRALLGRRPRRYVAPDVFPLRQLERDYITSVLVGCNWNQSLAARRLGIGRNTLLRKVRQFGLAKAAAA